MASSADMFFITSSICLADEEIPARLHKRVKEGARVVIHAMPEERTNDFLKQYGIVVTDKKICDLSGDRVVTFSAIEDSLRSADLFGGVEKHVIQQPYLVLHEGSSTFPVLAAHRDKVFLVSASDLPEEILNPPLVSCAIQYVNNESGGAILVFAGGSIHDSYCSLFGRQFPGIEENKVFAENLLRYLVPRGRSLEPPRTWLSDIELGESGQREFKSTLRYNMKTKKHDFDISFACLKTIAAFLNTDGGALYIGVSDHGGIIGIEADGFENADKFERHLYSLITARLTLNDPRNIKVRFHEYEGKSVCIVDCELSNDPVYLTGKSANSEPELYIRVGNSSKRLVLKDAVEYIKERFPRG